VPRRSEGSSSLPSTSQPEQPRVPRWGEWVRLQMMRRMPLDQAAVLLPLLVPVLVLCWESSWRSPCSAVGRQLVQQQSLAPPPQLLRPHHADSPAQRQTAQADAPPLAPDQYRCCSVQRPRGAWSSQRAVRRAYCIFSPAAASAACWRQARVCQSSGPILCLAPSSLVVEVAQTRFSMRSFRSTRNVHTTRMDQCVWGVGLWDMSYVVTIVM